ncbi:MAG: YceI family protein [Bacteroidota bacterium]
MKHIFIFLAVLICLKGISQKAYTLSQESKMEIAGTSTIHDWTVVAHTLEGTLETTEGKPTAIRFAVKVADLKSERGAVMDKKTHNALKKDLHPEVTFNLKAINTANTIEGVLSMAGITKTIEIPTEIIDSGGAIKISGEYPITLQDWEIDPPSAMFGQIVVGDAVTVKFDLLFSN